MVIPSETEISKNLEKEARNESWAEENKLHSCSTLDEESQPETSIGKGEVETDKAEGNIREMDKNESSIDEKGGETKNSTTGEGGTETVREKQVDEDVTTLFQSIQDDPIIREVGTGRNSSQLGKEEDSWEGSSDRIPTLEELAGLTVDEVTESGELIVATRSKPPISIMRTSAS